MNLISNKKHEEQFLNNEFFNKLIQKYIKEQPFVSVKEVPLEVSSPAVFAFCPSCGFKNDDGFAFALLVAMP